MQRAFTVASKAHAGQQRRNGEPVFVHCVETARTLADLGLTADVVAAGLLHDILDDTLMTEPQLRSHFSHSLVDMVCKVSRMSTICQLNRDQQADRPLDRAKLTDTLMCMADPRCVLIKLADRLHNMRTIAALPEQKRQRMAQESMDIFSPLANRLGVWSLKAELEDLCFQQLHPVQHSQLQKRLKESQHRGSIELALNKLSQHLDCIGQPSLCSYAMAQIVCVHNMQTKQMSQYITFSCHSVASHASAVMHVLIHSCFCRSQLQGAVRPAQELVGRAHQDEAEATGAGWHL